VTVLIVIVRTAEIAAGAVGGRAVVVVDGIEDGADAVDVAEAEADEIAAAAARAEADTRSPFATDSHGSRKIGLERPQRNAVAFLHGGAWVSPGNQARLR
jgi:hypothetical protein